MASNGKDILENTWVESDADDLPIDCNSKVVLVVSHGMMSGGIVEFELEDRSEFSVGRSQRADVRLDARSISRKHAEFSIQNKRLCLRDLGSTNGTFVNGLRIKEKPVPVASGDALRFGDVISHLQIARPSRMLSPRLIKPDEFDIRVEEEAERCLRFDRSLAAITIETTAREDGAGQRLQQTVTANLRVIDAATLRTSGRIDLLIPECAKAEALAAANRIHTALRSRNVAAKVGVATYPEDVPSAHSLLLAASVAMREAEDGTVGAAQAGARVIQFGSRELIIAEPAMVRLFGLVERVANSPMPVVIHGETGAGKELVAEAMHRWSPRADQQLVKLNCAALPENLLESELFGHEKGAFSGASAVKPGLLEEADGGTLFLDEIGDMALGLQAKLLRVLEDQRVRRVGATKDRQINVRVVAATHRDLAVMAKAGEFREDLFYRLSGVVLRVPALRDRRREIPLLAERFVALACEQSKREILAIAPRTMSILGNYEWPGNIRELRNVMSAAVMMCDGSEIEPGHLPPQLSTNVDLAPVAMTDRRAETLRCKRIPEANLEDEVRALERGRICEALDACEGNQTKAADALGMPRRTLVSKMAALGIRPPRRAKKGDRERSGP